MVLFIIGYSHVQCIGQIQKDLFVSGDYSFSNPAIAVTVKGTLIAICDVNIETPTDLPHKSQFALARSFDSGTTWKPLEYILDLSKGNRCGSPSLIIDQITGKIFCFYTHLQGPADKISDTTVSYCKYISSEDDGVSWSDPIEINSIIDVKKQDGMYTSSGHGIQTRSGRLVQPLFITSHANGNRDFQTQALNAYSDDHGETWHLGEPHGTPIGESSVVEMADGRILRNMGNRQFRNRSVSISVDGGKSFFGITQDHALTDPGCNAGITRYGTEWEGDEYNVLAFSNPASQTDKRNMTIRFSLDDGNSWPVSILVHEGPSANSSLIRLYDGGLGVLYENGVDQTTEKISFARYEKKLLDSLLEKAAGIEGISKRFRHSPDYYHSTHLFSLLPDTKDEIIFLGNSITDGGEWHELFTDSRMKNRGKSGDVTDGILYCLHTITKLNPAKIFLLVGTNDFSQGKSVSYVIANHKKIYDRISKESPRTKLYVQSILPVNDSFGRYEYHTDKTDLIIEANARLKEIASEQGHVYVDLFTPMSDMNYKLRKDLTEDGVHLNGRGYQVWKQVLVQNEFVN